MTSMTRHSSFLGFHLLKKDGTKHLYAGPVVTFGGYVRWLRIMLGLFSVMNHFR